MNKLVIKKFNLILLILLLLLYTFFLIPSLFAEKPDLEIYTYDSFNSEFGVGPVLKKLFEEDCNCLVNYVGLADAQIILSRLILEKKNSNADLVIGIDNYLLDRAEKLNLFNDHSITIDSSLYNFPAAFNSKQFIPFDFGWLAFIYSEKIFIPKHNFEEFLTQLSTQKISVSDPRTSSPGLILLYWIYSINPLNWSNYINELDNNIIAYPKGWSETYQMFLNEDVELVWSYVTSPLYHQIVENRTDVKAFLPVEGNPIQIEYAAILKSSKNKNLANEFLQFLISPTAQKEIPLKQWMFPITKVELPEQFNLSAYKIPNEIEKIKEDKIHEIINIWQLEVSN